MLLELVDADFQELVGKTIERVDLEEDPALYCTDGSVFVLESYDPYCGVSIKKSRARAQGVTLMEHCCEEFADLVRRGWLSKECMNHWMMMTDEGGWICDVHFCPSCGKKLTPTSEEWKEVTDTGWDEPCLPSGA